jgi:hypothetical protein
MHSDLGDPVTRLSKSTLTNMYIKAWNPTNMSLNLLFPSKAIRIRNTALVGQVYLRTVVRAIPETDQT